MKFLKKTLYVLIVLFLIYVIVSVFLPSEITIARERSIRADKGAVFGLVNNLKKWDYWSPWNRMDKNWKVKYFGPEEGTGAGYEWVSEKSDLGKGKLTVANSVGTDSILFDMFMEGRGNSSAAFYFQQKDSVVNVKWKMNTHVGFFARIFPGLFMDGMAGKYFEDGLRVLDSLSHTSMAVPAEGVEGISSFERKNVLSILDSCPERDLSFKISKLYEQIGKAFDPQTKVLGVPMTIYHSVSPDNVVFEAAICVDKIPAAISEKRILTSNINYKKVIVYNYYGSYSEIRNAYAKIFDYMTQKNLKQSGKSVEEYVSDPMVETNPDRWLTKVYVPVE